jgi:hypothetical protein
MDIIIIIIIIIIGGKEEEEIYPQLKLRVTKVDGYDFPHPCDDPRNSHLFLKQPLI